MQLTLAAAEIVAPDEEYPGFQDEGKEPFDGLGVGHSIFSRVSVFFPLAMSSRIQNDKDKYNKTQSQ